MPTNEQNLNILTDIHHGGQMAIESIDELLKDVDDQGFKDELMNIQNEHKNFVNTASKEIEKYGGTPSELGAFQKMSIWTMSNFQTVMDKSPQHIADIMVDGFNMGIKEIKKSINNNPDADENIKQLGQQFYDLQQRELDQMSKHLH